MQNLYHLLLFGYLVIPFIFIVIKLVTTRNEKVARVNINWKLILNLSIIYALAFNIVFFIQELFLALGKSSLGLIAYLYHNNHGWDGDHPMTALMQGSGALSILIFGILMFVVFHLVRKKTYLPLLKFFIWSLGFQGLVQALPQLQTAFLAPNTDVGQAMSYFNIGEVSGFIIALLVTILLVISIKKAFVQLNTLGLIDNESAKSQFRNILWIILIPTVLGCVITIPFRILPWDRAIMPFMSALTWLPWLLAFSLIGMKQSTKDIIQIPLKINFVLISGYILLLLFFQLILAPGLVF